MNGFSKLPPDLKWLRPEVHDVRESFTFESPNAGRVFVAKGFVTDGASVPRWLWGLYPPDGPYLPAAVVHDWLYRVGGPTRKQADVVFLEAMRCLGIPFRRCLPLYIGVRLFGRAAWHRNALRRANTRTLHDLLSTP